MTPPYLSFASAERVDVLCRRTIMKLERALMYDRDSDMTKTLREEASTAELASMALEPHGVGFFDKIIARIERNPVDRTSRIALDDARVLHEKMLDALTDTAKKIEWRNGDGPTAALRAVVRGHINLLIAGNDLRGRCRETSLSSLDEMFLQAYSKDEIPVLIDALAQEIAERGLVDRDPRFHRLDVIDLIHVAEMHAPSTMIERRVWESACQLRLRAQQENPHDAPDLRDWFAREEPGNFAASEELGGAIFVSWHDMGEPHIPSRDPFHGPAVEIHRLGSMNVVFREFHWRGERLGRDDEPFDIVLERFADRFPKDFEASLGRLQNRISRWLEDNPTRAEAELHRLESIRARVSPEMAEAIDRIVLNTQQKDTPRPRP